MAQSKTEWWLIAIGHTAQKTLEYSKLLDDLKFQWPKTPEQVKEVSVQQIEWLLQGLEMEPKKVHHPVKIDKENSCF